MFRPWIPFLLVALGGCAMGDSSWGSPDDEDASSDAANDGRVGPLELDAARPDAAMPDAAMPDAAMPDAATPDAAMSDAARSDATNDAARDASPDAPRDAAVDARRDAMPDAAPSGIAVDGVIGATEWAAATPIVNAVASNWGTNALTSLRAVALHETLYVAIEGAVQAGSNNAIVLYVDSDLEAAGGVDTLFSLSDGAGALDDSISAGVTTPAGFHVEAALGIRAMSRTATGFDAELGWRDLAANPANFAWVDAAIAPVSCSATACEASIPFLWLEHGGTTPVGTIAMFARIANHSGTAFSNQCLPEDDATMPNVATELLTIETP